MKHKFLPFVFLAMVATVSFFSCRKPDAEPIQGDENARYIPLQKGKYITYNVDSTIWYDTLCVKVVSHSQIMYTIADTFTDNGHKGYRVETRFRELQSHPWELRDVLYITRTDVNLEWSQSELRFIKMVFPVTDGATWQGNVHIPAADAELNYFNGWSYYYSNVGSPFNAGEVTYPKTVTVNQVDRVENDPETLPMSFGSRTYGKEVFAENIGMVYREYIRWTYDPSASFNHDPNQPDRCRKGTSVVMRAVDHN
jgi:hypothetical protein